MSIKYKMALSQSRRRLLKTGSGISYWKKGLIRDKYLVLMVLPVVAYYIIFHYIPMIGVIIAFKDYSPGLGILKSPWVGLQWFEEFFTSFYFFRVVRNTLLVNLYDILFGFPVPIIFALMVNEVNNRFFKRYIQTASYFPHFISVVIVVGMLFDFLAAKGGIVNRILEMFGCDPIPFMTQPEWFRTIYVASGIWQHFGWGSIIYLAALTGIDPQLYEAAYIDGGGKWKQLIYITLPSIAPTIIILLILRMGRLMSVGFEKVILMYSPAIYETADVIATFVYRRGLIESDFSYGAAVGLFNSIINFTLVVLVNKLSRKVNDVSLW